MVMTAVRTVRTFIDVAAVSVDDFALRCWARGYLATHERMDLQEAVDWLQDFAVVIGMVDAIGQDEVQAIMAKAFEPLCDRQW